MAILSKGRKPDKFELLNSLKLSFTNIQALHLNTVKCKCFLASNSTDILALYETNLVDSIDSDKFCQGFSSFNLKEFYSSYAWSCSLHEWRIYFCIGPITGKLCGFSFLLHVFEWLYFLIALLLFLLLIIFCVFVHDFWCYFI